ncbi:MAG: hypothetical protein IIY46_07255, partial [Lachnospiraceae bacterium]|nr:hypothetical protein [Lachnospiraceae bacterium]
MTKKTIRNKLLVVAAVMTVVLLWSVAVFAEDSIIASGSCGESVNWTLTEDGILTDYGNGAMEDY